MSSPFRSKKLACAATLTLLLSCGGGRSEGGAPVAAIVVPRAAPAQVAPGGALSFEGACSGAAGAVSHAWSFPGGTPAGSTAVAAPGPVTFQSEGTYEVTYFCTDGEGRVSAVAKRTVEVAAPVSHFAIRLQLDASAEPYRADLEWAAAQIPVAILGPVPGLANDPRDPTTCDGITVPTGVGFLAVVAMVEPLDGSRGKVAASGPCALRTSDLLPIAGMVRLDTADVPSLQAAGTFRHVILHEMIHVLGFGTLWGPGPIGFDLLASDASADSFFRGSEGRAAFRDFNGGSLYGGTPVPVESIGGAATQGQHWRAAVFGTELMTASVAEPAMLSRTTIQSLADLGYEVNGQAADTFLIPSSSAAAPPSSSASPDAAPRVEGVDLADDALPIIPRLRGP